MTDETNVTFEIDASEAFQRLGEQFLHLEREVKRITDEILEKLAMQEKIDMPNLIGRVEQALKDCWKALEFHRGVTKHVQEKHQELDARVTALTRLFDIDHAVLIKLAGLPSRPPGDPRAN
jgi:sulfur relay (sulfurtransferase) DsrC/TusE family protein